MFLHKLLDPEGLRIIIDIAMYKHYSHHYYHHHHYDDDDYYYSLSTQARTY